MSADDDGHRHDVEVTDDDEPDGSDRIVYIELLDDDGNVIGTYDRKAESG